MARGAKPNQDHEIGSPGTQAGPPSTRRCKDAGQGYESGRRSRLRRRPRRLPRRSLLPSVRQPPRRQR
jgi:hypothetical protein